MTYKEMLERDHPDCLNERLGGGCVGCPGDYYDGACKSTEIECDGFDSCADCRNTECPGTAQEAPKTAKNALKVMLDPGAKMPTRAHELDAGLDLYSRDCITIFPGMSCKFDTGVHVAIPAGYVGMVKSKSGLNVNHGLTSEGVIDSGYTGSIVVKLYNHGRNPVLIEQGQKISQLVILPIITPELELVDSLEETDRGAGGFGSTGKF